jgi:hypothetical protein
VTDIEKNLLKMVIQFAWDVHRPGGHGKLCGDARKIVIEMLGLTDERPLDTQKRKDALNAFLNG